jgi:GH35 family endo-1,4-beta-xylanase
VDISFWGVSDTYSWLHAIQHRVFGEGEIAPIAGFEYNALPIKKSYGRRDNVYQAIKNALALPAAFEPCSCEELEGEDQCPS